MSTGSQIAIVAFVLILFAVAIFGIRVVKKGRFLGINFLGHDYAVKRNGLTWVPPLGAEENDLPTTQQTLELELPPVLPALKEDALYPGEDGSVRTWHQLTGDEREVITNDRLSQQVPLKLHATLFWRYDPDQYFTFRENVGLENLENKIRTIAEAALHDEVSLMTTRTAIRRKPELGALFAHKVRIMSGEIVDPQKKARRLSWGFITDDGVIGPFELPEELQHAEREFAVTLAQAQSQIAFARAAEERLRKEGRGRAAAVESLREVMERTKGTAAAAAEVTRDVFQGTDKKTIIAPGIAGIAAGIKEAINSLDEK